LTEACLPSGGMLHPAARSVGTIVCPFLVWIKNPTLLHDVAALGPVLSSRLIHNAVTWPDGMDPMLAFGGYAVLHVSSVPYGSIWH
jgi:hypothetical protein